MTTLAKAPHPLRQQSLSVLMDQCSVTEELVQANPSWFAFLRVAYRWFLGGQLTVNHVSSVVLWAEGWAGGGGELDCDGWCGDAFSYWPEKLGYTESYQEKCPIKACQYGPSISLAKRLPVNHWLYHWARALGDWFTCLNAVCVCLTEGTLLKQCRCHINHWKYTRKIKIFKKRISRNYSHRRSSIAADLTI